MSILNKNFKPNQKVIIKANGQLNGKTGKVIGKQTEERGSKGGAVDYYVVLLETCIDCWSTKVLSEHSLERC